MARKLYSKEKKKLADQKETLQATGVRKYLISQVFPFGVQEKEFACFGR